MYGLLSVDEGVSFVCTAGQKLRNNGSWAPQMDIEVFADGLFVNGINIIC